MTVWNIVCLFIWILLLIESIITDNKDKLRVNAILGLIFAIIYFLLYRF